MSELSSHTTLEEPKLLFSNGNIDIHPLRGLISYGPYSNNLGYPNQVRLAYLSPFGTSQKIHALVSELQNQHIPIDATNYFPTYPGFETLLRTPLVPASKNLIFELPEECKITVANNNGEELLNHIIQLVGQAEISRTSFDVLLI